MLADNATDVLLADLASRGLVKPKSDTAVIGLSSFRRPGFGQTLRDIGVSQVTVVDGLAESVPVVDGIEITLLRHDPGLPLNEDDPVRQFDLIIDDGFAQHVFDVVELWRSIHRSCGRGGMVVTRQPMLGGEGLFNFIPEYFEDIAALNDYDVAFSSYVIGEDFVQLSSRVDTAVNTFTKLDLAFALVRVGDRPFRVPYQNVSVREAYGISGYTPIFHTQGKGRRYEEVHTGRLTEEVSTKVAVLALKKILLRRLRRLIGR